MRRILPYPLLTASLLLMWLLLNKFSLGHLILGAVIAYGASWAMTALQPDKPRVRRWSLLPRLLLYVFGDIFRSNIAVATIILKGKRRPRSPGFITIPLQLRDPTGLAILSCILTATPGTAWIEYHADTGRLMIHVLDLVDEQAWIDLIRNRYARMLSEIFE